MLSHRPLNVKITLALKLNCFAKPEITVQFCIGIWTVFFGQGKRKETVDKLNELRQHLFFELGSIQAETDNNADQTAKFTCQSTFIVSVPQYKV